MKIKPAAGALRAEISGIDLTGELRAEDYRAIRAMLVEHEVIFFRNQDVTPAQQHALASSFGPLQTHPAYATVEGFPEITILESTADKPSKIECWPCSKERAGPWPCSVGEHRPLPSRRSYSPWSSK